MAAAGAIRGGLEGAFGGGACREQRVFIRAEPEVRYDGFMGVMNRLKASGFVEVGLLNEDIE